MQLQDSDRKVAISCRFCGAVAQRVMDEAGSDHQPSYYECSVCGCLMKEVAGDAAEAAYLPKSGYLCRDTFLGFSVIRKLLELLAAPGVCLVSSQKNTGFLARMLADNGCQAVILKYLEKNRFLGVELNEYAYRPICSEDSLAGKIFVVLGTLNNLEHPLDFFETLQKQQPACIVALVDVYQGQDASWGVLQNEPWQNKIYYSHQAMHDAAAKIGYSLYAAENVYILTKEKLPAGESAFIKSLTALQYYDRTDFTNYLVTLKRRELSAENGKKSGGAEIKKRIFLAAPAGKILYVDCIFYQMANSGIARVWNEVFRVWSEKYADKVVLLDRGGEIESFGLPRIPFKRFDFISPSPEIRALSWFLLRKGAYRFASTYYTYSELHPTKAVVYDMIPENLSFDANDPQWVLKKMYLERSESSFGISGQTAADVVKFFPHLQGKSDFAYPGLSSVFKPISDQAQREFRNKIGVTARFLFVVPCALGGYKDGITALQAIDRLGIAKDSEVICTVPLTGQEKLIESLQNVKVRSLRFEDQDYANLIASADLVVWTPLIEGLGLPPMEAVACHTNVVVARTSVNVELYGNTVSYAEPRNVESFSNAIAGALVNGLGGELIDRVQQRSSTENFADRLFEYLYA